MAKTDSPKGSTYFIRVKKPKVIIIQMFGLLASEKWIRDTAVPFFRTNMKTFLQQNKNNGHVLIKIEALRAVGRKYAEDDNQVPTIEEDNANEADIIESLCQFLEWQYKKGRTNKPTSGLEHLGTNWAIRSGKLKMHLFDDVPETLKKWKKMDIKVNVDIPHMSNAEALDYMKNTSYGDLSSCIHGYLGNEKEFMAQDSITSYANMINYLNVPRSHILFITHFGQRAKEVMDNFGIETIMIDRTENRRIRSYYLVRFRIVDDLRDIEMIDTNEVLEETLMNPDFDKKLQDIKNLPKSDSNLNTESSSRSGSLSGKEEVQVSQNSSLSSQKKAK